MGKGALPPYIEIRFHELKGRAVHLRQEKWKCGLSLDNSR
jgi:hypothetical protein